MENNFVRLDWLEFTFKQETDCQDPVEDFLASFPEFVSDSEAFTVKDYGRFGYNMLFTFSEFYYLMYSDERREMGVHVQVPAHGLQHVAELFGCDCGTDGDHLMASDLLGKLYYRGGNRVQITRIDLCYDDYRKILTPRDYALFHYQERISCRFRDFRSIDSNGGTVYFGKRGKDKMLRIYDKDVESAGRIPAIRYELEFHHKTADLIGREIADQGYENVDIFLHYLRDDLQFKVKVPFDLEVDPDKNYKQTIAQRRCRAPIDEEFLEVFAVLESCVSRTVSIVVPKPTEESSTRNKAVWMANLQGAMALLLALKGSSKFIEECNDFLEVARMDPDFKADCIQFLHQDGMGYYYQELRKKGYKFTGLAQ